MEKIKEFFKKNWKMIVIVLLTIMFMNKCAVSCTKNQIIKIQNTELVSKDSLIIQYTDSIKYLNVQIDNLTALLNNEQHHSSAFSDIAIGNQKELLNTIKKLKNDNDKLKNNNKQLLQTVDELNKQLNDCK